MTIGFIVRVNPKKATVDIWDWNTIGFIVRVNPKKATVDFLKTGGFIVMCPSRGRSRLFVFIAQTENRTCALLLSE